MSLALYSIGFTQRSAEQFFETLRSAGIQRLLDVRLNNTSQLAAFAKRDDLRYFLRTLCHAEYHHEPLLSPTQEMLDAYKKRKGTWQEYELEFTALMHSRKIEQHLHREDFAKPTALLCSERTAEHCHRRLVMEYLASAWGEVTLHHL